MSHSPELGKLNADDFQQFVNQQFTIQVGGEGTALKLTECKTLPSPGVEGLRVPFTLLFECTEQTTLPQDTYTFDFPQLGTIKLFMVPVATGKHQITFN